MFLAFPHGVQRVCLNRLFRYAGLIVTLFTIALFSACSGKSVAPGNSTPASAAPPASLNVLANLPAGTVGATYTGSLSANGGTAPYTFTVVSGQLPAGTVLTEDSGAVSGTPNASGNFTFAVSVLDATGASQQKSLQIAIANSTATSGSSGTGSSGGTGSGSGTSGTGGSGGTNTNNAATTTEPSFSSLQQSGGWAQYGQRGPAYVDCSPSPCNGISFWMAQNVVSPSLSGKASEFNVGGSEGFGDALFNNHLIGPGSTQNLPDWNGTLVPSLHDFTYDVYFYGDDLGLSQAIEFDINQFFDGKGYIWGHECRIGGGNEWDVWDDQNAAWKPTGVACNPNSNSWNHLTIKVERNSNDELVYQSITLNGQTANLNWTFPPGNAPGWYGLTVNYQMDGNAQQSSYSVYLDNLTFSYQ